jgi:hypothetical protein
MEALVFYLVGTLVILGLLKKHFPTAHKIITQALIGSLKGWVGFLWGAKAKRGKGVKSVPQRMRYRD